MSRSKTLLSEGPGAMICSPLLPKRAQQRARHGAEIGRQGGSASWALSPSAYGTALTISLVRQCSSKNGDLSRREGLGTSSPGANDPLRPKLLANYPCYPLAQIAVLCVALTLRWADADR